MGFLSNLFSRTGGGKAKLHFGLVPTHRLNDALLSLLASPGQRPHTAQMIVFMQSAKARGMDLLKTQIASYGVRILYAILPAELPGKTLMLICGTPFDATECNAARSLLARVVAEHQDKDIAIIEGLVDPADKPLLDIYLEQGFARLAELIYLESPVRIAKCELPPGFTLETYTAENHADFATAILASYIETLDCPAINGVRHIDDIIAGHKAAGEFRPEHWFLLRQQGKPAGVLLLAKTPASDSMELVYIGLSPFVRARRIGTQLLNHAFTTAAQSGLRRLTTAVDAKNKPAVELYYRSGMQRIGARVAMIRVIHHHTPVSSTIHPQHAK